MAFCHLKYLPVLLSLFACQSIPHIEQEYGLPSAPHQELKSTHLFDTQNIPIHATDTRTIITSIQRLLSSTHPDRTTLEEISFQLFQRLSSSQDLDTAIMTLLAASSCHHPISKTLCRSLLRSSHPLLQLAAVQTLGNSSENHFILIEALRSDFLIIRLEAAWQLARMRSQNAFYHIDALSHKLPEEFRVYFPDLFAQEGSLYSIHRLKQLLYDADEDVITATLNAIGNHDIQDLKNEVLDLQSHSPAVLEAKSFALQIFDCDQSRNHLHKLAATSDPHVQIRACLSLIALGESSHLQTLINLAENNNPFALAALCECNNVNLASPKNPSRTSLLNYALVALEHKYLLSFLQPLFTLSEDEVLVSIPSPGQTLSYWQPRHTSSFDPSLQPMKKEEALRTQESWLAKCLELEERAFINLASELFEKNHIELFPTLCQLLENKRSAASIDLLHREAIRPGAPFNRAFATLSLVKLGEFSSISTVLDFCRHSDMKPWRMPLPFLAQNTKGTSEQQTALYAKLYIESLETLAHQGTSDAIKTLARELEQAPDYYLPFIMSAILHASL